LGDETSPRRFMLELENGSKLFQSSVFEPAKETRKFSEEEYKRFIHEQYNEIMEQYRA